jgi:uncharacterized protein (DUF1778 family)
MKSQDKNKFTLDAKQWDAFIAELDRTVTDNQNLRKLLTRQPAWEKSRIKAQPETSG